MHSTVMRSEMSLVSQNGVSLRLCAQSALLPLLPNSIIVCTGSLTPRQLTGSTERRRIVATVKTLPYAVRNLPTKKQNEPRTVGYETLYETRVATRAQRCTLIIAHLRSSHLNICHLARSCSRRTANVGTCALTGATWRVTMINVPRSRPETWATLTRA